MKRFALFAIALIAVAVVLQALIHPRGIRGGVAVREYRGRPAATATATPGSAKPSDIVSGSPTLPAAGR